MDEINQPYILNNVSDISGIEELILMLHKKIDGYEENEIKNEIFATSDGVLKQRLDFLKVLNLIEMSFDKIKLTPEFSKKISQLAKIAKIEKFGYDDLKLKMFIHSSIKLELIRYLALCSFTLNANQKYEFKKQAVILLIFSFMSLSSNYEKGLIINNETVSEINSYFKSVNYIAFGKTDVEIELNDKKLSYALAILVYLGLANNIKMKSTKSARKEETIYFPIVDSMLLDLIINEIINEGSEVGQSESEFGFPLFYLLNYIGRNYFPIIKNDAKYQSFISQPLGGSLWALYTNNQINLIFSGDYPPIDDKPNFINAKFRSNINWLTKVNNDD